MPSVWSAMTDEPTSTVFGSATLAASTSVIALAMLPLATLQPEPGNQYRCEQERDHGGGDGGALPEVAAADGALIAQRCHQMRCVDGAAARQHPDELEIGEGEQYREGHHNGDNRSEQRIGDVTKHQPAARPVDRCGLIQRR